jgi:IS1 family transposase
MAMNTLPLSKKVQVIANLCEGASIRSVERLTETHRDTVMRLGRDVGEGCARLHDRLFKDLQVNLLEVDELWSFVGKKQGHLQIGDSVEFGDWYTFLGVDANRKAIVSYLTGRRDGASTDAFCLDLRARILNRPQISSDGYQPYVSAIEEAFGADVDYGQIVKEYAGSTEVVPVSHRYSPPRVVRTERIKVAGEPDPYKISTSYVERNNLNVRMGNRRFTRLTNAFSKTQRNHVASVALYVCYHNLCRVHTTLRTTPAMAMGLTDHVWTVEELIVAALAKETTPESPKGRPSPEPTPAPMTPSVPVRFTVLRGGKELS